MHLQAPGPLALLAVVGAVVVCLSPMLTLTHSLTHSLILAPQINPDNVFSAEGPLHQRLYQVCGVRACVCVDSSDCCGCLYQAGLEAKEKIA